MTRAEVPNVLCGNRSGRNSIFGDAIHNPPGTGGGRIHGTGKNDGSGSRQDPLPGRAEGAGNPPFLQRPLGMRPRIALAKSYNFV